MKRGVGQPMSTTASERMGQAIRLGDYTPHLERTETRPGQGMRAFGQQKPELPGYVSEETCKKRVSEQKTTSYWIGAGGLIAGFALGALIMRR